MKLRIKDNSIRLRLSKSEIDQFAQEGFVEKTTYFGPDKVFIYRIEESDQTHNPGAELNPFEIKIIIPTSIFHQWVTTDQVSIKETITLGKQDLELLIEKDFQCLHRDWEDKKDLYVNPNL